MTFLTHDSDVFAGGSAQPLTLFCVTASQPAAPHTLFMQLTQLAYVKAPALPPPPFQLSFPRLQRSFGILLLLSRVQLPLSQPAHTSRVEIIEEQQQGISNTTLLIEKLIIAFCAEVLNNFTRTHAATELCRLRFLCF